MIGILTPHQQAIAARALDEEESHRRHLVVSLSGAHAYGFPSPDSDLDLKSIHIAPTAELLGLEPVHVPAERLEIIEGIEIDYSSNELRDALNGIVRGNGNYLERVLGHLPIRASPLLEELKPLVQDSLSRRLHHHYQGFSRSQFHEWEKGAGRSAKKLLYVLRTGLTGAHALLTGELQIDVTHHLDRYGFGAARELIEQKKSGELAELPEPMIARWRSEIVRLFALLDDAADKSPLPLEAPNVAQLNEWLLAMRRTCW